MYILDLKDSTTIKDEIYSMLVNRKNFMFYDGIRDGLDNNISFKFFYSSPKDPLEFINIDIYNTREIKEYKNETIEYYGLIYITKNRVEKSIYNLENKFGYVLIKDIQIRGVDKHSISLFLSKNGISNVLAAIEYFENALCVK